jgi:lipoprotein-anchoring transpeptidase ErfK/SrfK
MKNRLSTLALAVALSAGLSGCAIVSGSPFRNLAVSYGPVSDGGFRLPTVPAYKIPKKYHRQVVGYDGGEKPGTIIVDTGARFLYLVEDGGTAIRYGIGIGREGFEWSGSARIAAKKEWPVWTPPPEMIRRQPELVKFRNGQDPGLTNPLGARALYLYNKNGDTGYRLHGSPEWWSIGRAVSSGCIRLINQDIIDLYNRAQVGAKVIVK